VHAVNGSDDRASISSETTTTRMATKPEIVAESQGGVELREHVIEADAFDRHW